jgi:NADH-quinone oxidoreductase subunit K
VYPNFKKVLVLNILNSLRITVILFFISILGLILNRKNILITIIALEILLLSVNINFTLFSLYLDDILGQIFVLFILTVAATESSIGLAILTTYFKLRNTIQINQIININK